MKKRTAALIYIILGLLILATGIGIGILVSGNQGNKNVPVDNTSELEDIDPFDGLVSTVEGTTPEMLKADYWIQEDSDKVLFSNEEIADFNDNNPLFVSYSRKGENKVYRLYMYDLPETISGEAVFYLMWPEVNQRFSIATNSIYINGELPNDDYWTELEEKCAIDLIPDEVEPQYYICPNRVDAKLLPTDDFASTNPNNFFSNSFISAVIMPFSGVVGLHESTDGQWVYVIGGSFCGWVRKETLALCEDKKEWLEACRPEHFIVVTGSEVVMDETAMPTYSSGMILPMGTIIRLSNQQSDMVNGRSTFGSFVVEIPYRDDDGRLSWEKTLVPVSKDVHMGYLTMTSESVVDQAFKWLGRVYGYGGTLASNDCSGIVSQIYACYGLELPRNSRAIAKLTDLGSFDCEPMTTSKKRSILAKMPAGMPLYMDGHLMIYLGSVEGKPYVISSCTTCIEPGHELNDIREVNCVFVSNMDLLRSNGKTWLEDICFILWKEY